MLSGCVTVLFCSPQERFEGLGRSTSFVRGSARRTLDLRRCSLRSPEPAAGAGADGPPLMPLLKKELWEILGGRALWTMLLLLCPLVGWSFAEAVRLYGEASTAARDSPIVASGLSPLDGI